MSHFSQEYEERSDGAAEQPRRDEVDHRGGGGGGLGAAGGAAAAVSIVPTQKMLQDQYEQNLRCAENEKKLADQENNKIRW